MEQAEFKARALAFWNTRSTGWYLRFSGCVLVTIGIAHLIRKMYDLHDGYAFIGGALLALAMLTIFLRHEMPLKRTWFIWSFLPLLLFGFWYYFHVEFGYFNWSSIIFHFLGGLDDSKAINEYFEESLQTIVGILAIAIGFLALKNGSRLFYSYEKWLALAVLALTPAFWTGIGTLLSVSGQGTGLVAEYVAPRASFPAGVKPKNFIMVFLESAERTLFNESEFGTTMKPLLRFEQKGISATNMRQVEQTAWSVAGMSASLCGVPLSPIGMVSKNSFDSIRNFLPGATCLGDILSHDGYQLSYIVGADSDFGGISRLYSNHGFDHIIDNADLIENYKNDPEIDISKHRTEWGSHDNVVFRAGVDEVKKRVVEGKPFGIVLETIGGHSPHGYVAPPCKFDPRLAEVSVDILKGTKCSNLLVSSFIEELENEGLLNNTVVFVQSDHLGMKSSITDRLTRLQRRNLFIIYNADIPPRIVDRPSTMMDIYPTVLETLGYKLENGAAGVGRSLLGSQQTLAERFGISELEDYINNDNQLSLSLWSTENATTAEANSRDVSQ